MSIEAPRRRPVAAVADADGMGVASFVLGLIGLLIFNVVLGPCALALGALSLARGTKRRFRAGLGLALGVADLVILALVLTGNHGVVWQLGA